MTTTVRLDDMDAWRRLGKAAASRRVDLRLNQDDLVARGGPAAASVQNIENAYRDAYDRKTLAKLEHALGWVKGSVEALLFAGVEPTVVPERAKSRQTDGVDGFDVIAAIRADPNLLPEAKAHLVNQYGLLLRVQRATALPQPSEPPSPVDVEEAEFVETGQLDGESQGNLRLDGPGNQNRR